MIGGCACSSLPPKLLFRQEPSTLGPCGGVTIAPIADRFSDAFDIAFRLSPSDVEICGPFKAYSHEVTDTMMVELWPERADCVGREKLTQPLLFQSMSARGGAGPIDFTPGSNMETPTFGEVPSGRYRLALRYVTAPCESRVFDRTCITCSAPFTLEDSVRYGIESSDVSEGKKQSNKQLNHYEVTPWQRN
jgi:hypothetical protein